MSNSVQPSVCPSLLQWLCHELRDPLNGLQLHLEVLRRRGVSSEDCTLFGLGLDQIHRIVEQLECIARTASNRSRPAIETVDLGVLTVEALARVSAEPFERAVPLRITNPIRRVPAIVDIPTAGLTIDEALRQVRNQVTTGRVDIKVHHEHVPQLEISGQCDDSSEPVRLKAHTPGSAVITELMDALGGSTRFATRGQNEPTLTLVFRRAAA